MIVIRSRMMNTIVAIDWVVVFLLILRMFMYSFLVRSLS